MAELTAKDKNNYEDLKKVFSKHNTTKDENEVLKHSLNVLNIDTNPNNTDELRQKIEELEFYLKILKRLGEELFKVDATKLSSNPKNKEEKEKLEQDFLNLLTELKYSFKVVAEKPLDSTGEIEELCSNSVILGFLQDTDIVVKQNTQALLENRIPNLSEEQINNLTSAWGTAINEFVEDARQSGGKLEPANPEEPGTQKTLANFFCLHNELELIYSRLADTETLGRLS
ncbi:hypothetical protein [Nostoc sp. GT001]|uniref:hypothetical protein n=1 Tax=Nostoc sp. GT001 TaxID=3056647 RepID=UPI0025AAAAD6|nr:hypothetical protein [Nostoc sp. GT001]MDM9580115.1 hypothetical protein [Nostoc sp. GT001]